MRTKSRLPLYIGGGAAASAVAVTVGILISSGPGGAPAAARPTTGAPTTITTRDSGFGPILVDGSGRTLYLFEKDTPTSSGCTGNCVKYWPRVPATSGGKATGQAKAADLSSISVPDGRPQLTYAGHPLYYFVGDQRPGDTNGQNIDQFGAEWYVLGPSGAAVRD